MRLSSSCALRPERPHRDTTGRTGSTSRAHARRESQFGHIISAYPVAAEQPENELAMVVKALAAAIVSAVVSSLVITTIQDPSELSSGLVLFFFLYGLPIASVAALTVGLPAHLLLSWFRVRSLIAYLIAGLIAAFVFGVWVERLPVTPHTVSWREVLRGATFALPGGLVAAAMFRRVAVRPRLTTRLPIDK